MISDIYLTWNRRKFGFRKITSEICEYEFGTIWTKTADEK